MAIIPDERPASPLDAGLPPLRAARTQRLRYAPAPEATPVRIDPRYRHFIDGAFTDPLEGRWFATVDPARDEHLADVAFGSAADVERAVKAARVAYDRVWSRMKPAERAKYVYRIARAITERGRELAVVETRDTGKPIKESRDFDIPQAAAHVFYYAGWADKLAWALRAGRTPAPLGVVGAIVPWNFPLLMAAWKIAPALACGNTVVLKPAETTPLTALLLAQIARDADLPPGVLNVVTGDGTTGAALVAQRGLDKLAFTGSTDVGKTIRAALAGTSTRLTLELGGKSAVVVLADAPLDDAVEGIVNGIYFNAGQVCCAGSRLLVAESVADELVARLRARIETLRVGDPLDKNTDIGAINSRAQYDRIAALVADGIAAGARYHESSCELPPVGLFRRPSFFTGVHQSQRIAREEIFGPVLVISTFRTADEAIEKANNTPYGLAASVWSASAAQTAYVAARLRAGVVWCSTANRFDPASPFGGYRESGFGREGGIAGLLPYLA